MEPLDLAQITSELQSLPLDQLEQLVNRQSWVMTARPDQLPPHEYFVWLMLAGRGSGKTRAGAEEVWWPASLQPQRIAVVGPTFPDVRKTCFEGESGLLSVVPKSMVDSYNRTSLEMWLKNGSYFVGYSSEEPERLRGPQHHRAWCDELAAWRYAEETWDMLMFGLRLGTDPNIIVTTTPKKNKLLRDIIADSDTVVSRASTFDNASHLPRKILEKLRRKYEGTRLGRQELMAEIIDDNPYALWHREVIESSRTRRAPDDISRVVVAVDPPASSGEDADECGIVVAGVDGRDTPHTYVLDDGSCQGLTPAGWAAEVVRRYHSFRADAIVAEVNNGGDMVEAVIRECDPEVPVIKVHATRGKVLRAEPVSMLYEQQRVHHVGHFGTLEDQMCDFTTDFDKKISGYSPDRVDALVWAVTELVLGDGPGEPGIRTL